MTLTPEQQAERKHSIGGSDAAAACGVSPWKSRVELWMEKTGRVEPADLSDQRKIRRGNRLEDFVASEYEIETGRKLRRRNMPAVHSDYAFMTARLDRVVQGEQRVVELKTAHPMVLMSEQWGEAGTDAVPDQYLFQVHHQLIVTQWSLADLAAMFGDELRIYNFEADPELAELIVAREKEFWEFVTHNEPPPLESVRDVLAFYPVDSGRITYAGPEVEDAHRELMALRPLLKAAQQKEDELKDIIKLAMGDAAEIVINHSGETLATWRASKPSKRLDAKRLKAERPDVYSEFEIEVPGSRRFLPKSLQTE